MQLAWITALGVGGATIAGAFIGFLFPNVSEKTGNLIMSFAGGIMLAAAILGLILPAIEMNGAGGIWMIAVGILSGALFINLMDKLTPHLHNIAGVDEENHYYKDIDRVLLFVLAIGIHNLPEGLAAGVSFGGENISNAISVAVGIALQNIPEGMVIISPMIMAGISKKKTFLIAASTGVIEIIGTMIGYAATTLSTAILPFALSFAGGTMLYVVEDEMIPETHGNECERTATYTLLSGFVVMLIMNWYIV